MNPILSGPGNKIKHLHCILGGQRGNSEVIYSRDAGMGDRLPFHFHFLSLRPLISLLWAYIQVTSLKAKLEIPTVERSLLSILHTCTYMSSFLRAWAGFAELEIMNTQVENRQKPYHPPTPTFCVPLSTKCTAALGATIPCCSRDDKIFVICFRFTKRHPFFLEMLSHLLLVLQVYTLWVSLSCQFSNPHYHFDAADFV